MTKTILTLSLIALWVFPSLSQQSLPQEELTVSAGKVKLLGKTEKLSDLIYLPLTSKKEEKFIKSPKNFSNRTARKVANPHLEHQGIDPLRIMGRSESSTAELEVMVNRVGLQSSGSFPHDPTGSIGKDFYIQAINSTRIGVYNKAGNLVTTFNGDILWSDLIGNSDGDPIILYDQELSRWIITEFFIIDNGPDEPRGGALLIAVSETSDPLGSYYAYEFENFRLPDYPKYGIWNDHLVVSTNELGPGQLHQYFIDRPALMRGDEEVAIQRTSLQGANLESPILITVPVDFEGNVLPNDPSPIILRLNDSSWGQTPSNQDGINIYKFDVDYDDPSNTSFTTTFIPTSPYDGYPCTGQDFTFDCMPQLNGTNVGGIPETIMNTPQYRNFGSHESIVLTFITDVTNGNNLAGIRWMELRNLPEENQWTLYQEGTYSPDDLVHRFMPSIAIDKTGCIAIAYNTASEDQFIGLSMTGRCVDDPLGEMTVPEFTIAEGTGTLTTEQTNGNGQVIGARFGDYSHMSVDPTDELTMWFTAEVGASGLAQTRIVSFRLNRDSIDLQMNGLSNLESGFDFTDSEIIDVAVLNQGKTELNSYEVGYMINGVQQEILTVNEPIATRDTVVTSFTVPADLSERGDYIFTTFVNYIDDSFQSNDTTVTTVYHFAEYNAILNINPITSDCGTSKTFELEVTNKGLIPIENGEIEITFNGEIIDTINWFTDLETLEQSSIEYDLRRNVLVDNIIEAKFLHTTEEFTPEDNIDSYSFGNDVLGVEMVLSILTDLSPEETTWEVEDQETGEIAASGGPYTEPGTAIEEEFCLDPDRCYIFRMNDAGGDGLCCDNGTGLYSLRNGAEDLVFNGSIFFESEDVNSFCPGNLSCDLFADYNIGFSDVSGSLFINADGGVGPYTYSIDGGVTFQDENLFDNLEAGGYHIVVLDSDGFCSYIDFVTVNISTSTQEIENELINVIISPNPTEGVFKVDITGTNTTEQRLSFQILDASGRFIQEQKMTKQDDAFTTQISLLDYPDGIYYLRVSDKGINQLIKIIKQ